MFQDISPYGQGDNSFVSAGKEDGIQQLVSDFYDVMDSDPKGARIFNLHSEGKPTAIDKLARFLCGWLGGPKRYAEKYGSLNIPAAHRHLALTRDDEKAWLYCMEQAIAKQPYAEPFKTYLLTQLKVPANRIMEGIERISD